MPNKKLIIEISIDYEGDACEHEGYYTSATEAKKTIDEIFNAYYDCNEEEEEK